jgi:hypothetical protein
MDRRFQAPSIHYISMLWVLSVDKALKDPGVLSAHLKGRFKTFFNGQKAECGVCFTAKDPQPLFWLVY